MDTFLDMLTKIIINDFFLNSRCLLVFTDQGNSLHYNGDMPVVNIQVGNESIHPDVFIHEFGCQGIIMKTDKPVSNFQNFENEIKVAKNRFNSRKYLILPGNDLKENLSDILTSGDIKFVADLDVVEQKFTPDKEYAFVIWTYAYIGEGTSNKIVLDEWYSVNKSFLYNNDLYPNKLNNQMGRMLKMATFNYEPYSVLDGMNNQYKGSEMLMATTFAQYYNMTPYYVVNEEDYWGEIFPNRTGNGLLGNLVQDRADIGFAALYTWEEAYKYLDLSKPLVRTGITCLVPAPKLARGWLTPVFSYSPKMWIAVGMVFSICALMIFFLHYTHQKMYPKSVKFIKQKSTAALIHSSAITIFKLYVLQTVSKFEIPTSKSGICFMGLLYIFEVFLTSTYSSGLASIMTIPRYEDPVNTVDEFYRSQIYWGATQDAWITSIQRAEDDKNFNDLLGSQKFTTKSLSQSWVRVLHSEGAYIPAYVEIVRRFKSLSETELRELSLEGNFAFSIERLPRGNFAIGTYIQKDVIDNYHLMQEDFYWEQCVIMARKNSVLLPMLDKFILRVFEYGLISYWQNEAVISYMDADVQSAVKYYSISHDKKKNVVKLKWFHVEGAFGILCLGHFLSIVIFIFEIGYYNLVKQK